MSENTNTDTSNKPAMEEGIRGERLESTAVWGGGLLEATLKTADIGPPPI
jgi:hypothetical protein